MNTTASNLSIKLKLVYLRLLVLIIGFLLGYSLLNWLLVIHFEILKLPEDVANIWVPTALSVILLLVFFNPRLKLLALKTKKADLPGLFFVITIAAMALPVIITQCYLTSATGTLTKLSTIDQINSLPRSKYYEVKNFKIDTANIGIYRHAEVSGKNNEHLNLYIDVVCPMTKDGGKAEAWLGTEYRKQISNSLSDADKELAYKNFNLETFKTYQTQDLSNFVYLKRVSHGDKENGFKHALEGKTGAELALLEAVNEPYEARNGNMVAWIFGSLAIGSAVWLFLLAITDLDQAALKKFYEAPNRDTEDGLTFIKGLFNTKNNIFATAIIASVNIIVFLAMVFAGLGFMSFGADDLLKWGANFGPSIQDGQVWRLVTATFLHGGIMHLGMNMYGLFFVAIFLEPLIGKWRFVLAYFICGIAGSINSLWWHPDIVGVGASGAIFGLYGVILPLLLAKRTDPRITKVLLINSVVFIGLNLLIGMRGGIDNAAHLGGLTAGLLTGSVLIFFIQKPKPKTKRRKKITIADQSATANEQPADQSAL